jgi:hypothetical protein
VLQKFTRYYFSEIYEVIIMDYFLDKGSRPENWLYERNNNLMLVHFDKLDMVLFDEIPMRLKT